MKKPYLFLVLILLSTSIYAEGYKRIPFKGCGTVTIIYHTLSGETLDPESFLKSLCGDEKWSKYSSYFSENDVFKKHEILDEVGKKLSTELGDFNNKKQFVYRFAIDMEPYSFDSKSFDISLRTSDGRPGHYAVGYGRHLEMDMIFPKNEFAYVPKTLDEAKLIEKVTSKGAKKFSRRRGLPALFYLEAINTEKTKAPCCGKNPGEMHRIVLKTTRIDVVYPDYDQNSNLPDVDKVLFSIDFENQDNIRDI